MVFLFSINANLKERIMNLTSSGLDNVDGYIRFDSTHIVQGTCVNQSINIYKRHSIRRMKYLIEILVDVLIRIGSENPINGFLCLRASNKHFAEVTDVNYRYFCSAVYCFISNLYGP